MHDVNEHCIIIIFIIIIIIIFNYCYHYYWYYYQDFQSSSMRVEIILVNTLSAASLSSASSLLPSSSPSLSSLSSLSLLSLLSSLSSGQGRRSALHFLHRYNQCFRNRYSYSFQYNNCAWWMDRQKTIMFCLDGLYARASGRYFFTTFLCLKLSIFGRSLKSQPAEFVSKQEQTERNFIQQNKNNTSSICDMFF